MKSSRAAIADLSHTHEYLQRSFRRFWKPNAGNSYCCVVRCFAPGSGKFTKGHLVLASGEYLRVSIYLPVNKTVEPKPAYF